MIHIMKLQDAPFKMIKEKTKTIELRLYDEKRRKIEPDDIIEFHNIKTEETIKVKVINLYKYPDFTELYKHFDKQSLGYKTEETKNAKNMEQYYSEDEIKKYGVVGIEIIVI